MTRNQNKLNTALDVTVPDKESGINDLKVNNAQKDLKLLLNGKEQEEKKEKVRISIDFS